MTGTSSDHPIVYLYCIAIAAVLLYVPGFVVAAYGRGVLGDLDHPEPRTGRRRDVRTDSAERTAA